MGVKNKTPEQKAEDLTDVLEDIQVDPPGMWENHVGPENWWGVSTGDEGIIAYFFEEQAACRFRLAEVNRRLNG